jgi:integrase
VSERRPRLQKTDHADSWDTFIAQVDVPDGHRVSSARIAGGGSGISGGIKYSGFRGLSRSRDIPARTLSLQSGVPVQVVAQRLGHVQVSMTLEVYAHALPDMQRDAAARLGALLGS